MTRERKTMTVGRLCAGIGVALMLILPAVAGCAKSEEPGDYIKKLESDDAEVQRRAVEDLVRMHKKAMPEVKAALKSPNPNVRKGCAAFLKKVHRMESVAAAGELINDPEKDVRLAAIEAVSAASHVWKKRSAELLTQAFEQSDPECVQKAGEGLRDMRFAEATDVLRQKFESGEGMQAIYAAKLLYEEEPSAEVARPILEGLVSDNMAIREAAKQSAAALQDQIVAPLVAFVDTEERTVRAEMVLDAIRDALIEELNATLDSTRAAEILMSLGTIADEESIEKVIGDLHDTKLETGWRVSAEEALAEAALAARSTVEQKRRIRRELLQTMEDKAQKDRIRIGAAIALCRLRQQIAVDYLLAELSRSEEAIQAGSRSDDRLDGLTQLRIRAQQALTASGDFVVPSLLRVLQDAEKKLELLEELGESRAAIDAGRISPALRQRLRAWGVDVDETLKGKKEGDSAFALLMAKAKEQKPGDITIWAAVKTLGDLGVAKASDAIAKLPTVRKEPQIAMREDGGIGRINGGAPATQATSAEFAFLFGEIKQGRPLMPQQMKDWQELSEAEAQQVRDMLEVFRYPDFVRLCSAIALGQIGGRKAVDALKAAEKAEVGFLALLAANRERADYYKRAAVMDKLTAQHEDVLFYIRKSLTGLGEGG